ncbi:MAG: pilus assembly protein FimT, partial [Sphaerotilus sp.]
QPLGTTTGTRLMERHARGDGSAGVQVEVRDASCRNTTSLTQVVFNGFGRAQTDPVPIRCIVITHPGSTTTRTLHVMLNTGGSARTCDPAATDPLDTRRCLVN